jgi:hypothetical protein
MWILNVQFIFVLRDIRCNAVQKTDVVMLLRLFDNEPVCHLLGRVLYKNKSTSRNQHSCEENS